MDPDPLCGLSDCSSTSARSSWSSSAAEDSEEEWRHQVDELRRYIDPSSLMPNGGRTDAAGTVAAADHDGGKYEVSCSNIYRGGGGAGEGRGRLNNCKPKPERRRVVGVTQDEKSTNLRSES